MHPPPHIGSAPSPDEPPAAPHNSTPSLGHLAHAAYNAIAGLSQPAHRGPQPGDPHTITLRPGDTLNVTITMHSDITITLDRQLLRNLVHDNIDKLECDI